MNMPAEIRAIPTASDSESIKEGVTEKCGPFMYELSKPTWMTWLTILQADQSL